MSNADTGDVRVWDLFVRAFHWTLVASFAIAFLTGDDFETLHRWAGYLVGALIAARIIWGFVGPQHARFSDFVYKPRTALTYIRDLLVLRAARHIGHSPGGGAMVVVLLAGLAATVATGIIHDTIHGGGAGHFVQILARLHEPLANVTLLLVLIHVAAVAFASFAHRENLVRSMITGRKRR